MTAPVLAVLADLSRGDRVRITPDSDDVFTPVYQPEEPFETTVRVLREGETTAVPPEDAVERRASEQDCHQREVLFETPPATDDAAYVTYRRRWPDDSVTGGTLFARNSFYRDWEKTPTETEIAEIDRIELLDAPQ